MYMFLVSQLSCPFFGKRRVGGVVIRSLPASKFSPPPMWDSEKNSPAPPTMPTRPNMLAVFMIHPRRPLAFSSCLRNCAQANLQPRKTPRRFTLLSCFWVMQFHIQMWQNRKFQGFQFELENEKNIVKKEGWCTYITKSQSSSFTSCTRFVRSSTPKPALLTILYNVINNTFDKTVAGKLLSGWIHCKCRQ